MAFQHSISPESQSESLDKALTNLENSGLIQGVIKLVTFPWHALVTCKDALVWLLMLPIRAVSGTLNSLGRAGNATVDIINRCIRWLLNLPVHLTQSFLDAIGHGLTTMSEGLARHSRHLARALSGSFLGAFFHRLADGFLATTKGLEFAWNISNDIAASGALAVEAIGRQLFQFTQNGIALSISAWNATKSTLVIATQNVRTGWTSTNHTVACVAFAIEDGINLSWKAAFHLARRTETLATAMGITRDSMDTITEQSKLKLIAGYNSLDQAAERLGFFLEELLAKLSTKLKNARWNLRSP